MGRWVYVVDGQDIQSFPFPAENAIVKATYSTSLQTYVTLSRGTDLPGGVVNALLVLSDGP